jgi:O-antigen/teichoic acid export membrane protein
MKSAATVARNSVWLIAQPLIMGVTSLVVTAIVARHLGTNNYGVLLLLLSYAALFSPISNLGLRPYSVREIAASRERALEIVEDMLVLRFSLALLAVVIAVVYLVFVNHQIPPLLIALLIAQLIFNALAGCFIDGLCGLESMKSVATAMGTSGILVQLACVIAVVLKVDLVGVVSAYTLGSISMFGISWYLFHKLAGGFTLQSLRRHHWTHVQNSWTFFLQNLVGTIRQRIDVVLINSLLGPHAAGIYGSAQTLIQRLDPVYDGIATALFPRAANLHGGSTSELRELVRGAFKIVLVISTPIAVGLYGVADDVIALIFGTQYEDSAAVLKILALSVPLAFCYGVMFEILRATRQERLVLQFSAVASVMSVCYMVIGIKFFGILGASVAFVLGLVTLVIPATVAYWRKLGSPVSFKDLAGIAIANIGMGSILWLIRDLHLAIKILVSAIVFGALIVSLRIITLAMIKSILGRRRSTT